MLDIKKQFPIFKNYPDLVFLDSAASSQKPKKVIEAEVEFYEKYYANIHRGIYYLSAKATDLYDLAREKIQKFINAKDFAEIIFTRNATEGINLVASSYVDSIIEDGDEIIISHLEHHANIVPWQLLKKKKQLKLKIIPINDEGIIDFKAYQKLFSSKTKFVALSHVSNVLGNIIPVKQFIDYAHKKNVKILIDGCQAVTNFKVDIQELDVDFYVFSGHKLYGPSGIGVLYGKKQLLEPMLPYQGGGDMISSVSFEHTQFNDLPSKFEAGTPAIAQAHGLGAAIDFINEIGLDNIANHNANLLKYLTDNLMQKFSNIKIFGDKNLNNRIGVLSFLLGDIHPHDVATFADQDNIALRTGHHCAEPLMERLHLPSTIRASFGVYNNEEDIDKLIKSLEKIQEFFK